MKHKKSLALILSLITALTLSIPVMAQEGNIPDKIIILHTNDVHCGIDDNIGYAGLVSCKAQMEQVYGRENVTLVDAGDAIQGGAIGTLSDGAFPVDIMNQAGYDIAVPGNHEFDYGMDNFLRLAEERAEYTYVCSNFINLKTGSSVFLPFKILSYGDVDVAYVGIDTPESFTKSTPLYFQDDEGNYIYGFCQGNNGQDLYDNVQNSVDTAIAMGADYVIAIGHLGLEGSTPQWQSEAVIANTNGIDAFIDGHSHEAYDKKVKNKDGKEVVLAQTGTKLNAVGKIVLDPKNGTITAELIENYTDKDPVMDTFIHALKDGFADVLGQVVAKSDVTLTTKDPSGNERLIRNGETNLGDLCADAYRSVMGADIGIVNGGGIRADIKAGNITYEDIINVHPYGNEMCVVEATGHEILDALELGASLYPEENGGFLQVSGLTYSIDPSIPSSVIRNDEGEFLRVNGEYRVSHVLVDGIPLDPAKTYTVASHNYMIKNGGDGFTMFRDNKLLQDCTMLDNQVLIDYITKQLKGIVGKEYAMPYGEGRISIIYSASAAGNAA